ncbi:MAG: selenium metabolism-associated LysR family transcriptional regulator [Bacillota bacterium]|nr:selenium metabolism-associated LysR family transcriptional regulator [Bacillota bacterium]
MDIRQLETFVEVVESKNFSKAAENLYLTQPTVSAHVNALEREFKVQLIKRTTKEFEVTEAGQELYDYALKILNLKDKINESLLGARGDLIKIGSSSAISMSDLPVLIKKFHQAMPGVKFEITNSDSLDIINKVNDGLLEIGLVGTKVNDYNLQFIPFTEDELLFIMPKEDQYKKIMTADNPLKEVLAKPFIMREDQSGTRNEILKYFSSSKVSLKDLNIVASMSDPLSILESVRLGLGVSIISSKVVYALNYEDLLLTCPLNRDKKRQFYITCQREKYMSILAKAFLDFLIKEYAIKI